MSGPVWGIFIVGDAQDRNVSASLIVVYRPAYRHHTGNRAMKYGGVVVLVQTGTILYFAVNVEVQTLHIEMVGLILLVARVGLTQHRCC